MCLILDTNKYSNFLNSDDEDMQPIRKWIKKGGKLAYAATEKFEFELNKTEKMKSQFAVYRERGKVKLFDKKDVEDVQSSLSDLTSDDSHILALALVANVKLLVSSDTKLHADFKNIIEKGKIYQNKKHRSLLSATSCP